MRKFALIVMFLGACLSANAQQKQSLSAAATTCTTTGASCLIVGVDPQQGGATLTVTANASSNTIQFEASGDGGTTWVALNATPSNSTTAATSTTSTGTWQTNIAGYTTLRMRMSSLSGGTTTVSIIQSIASARAGGGGGGGSGNTTSTALTTNKLPKSNGANSIIDSSITDNGTTVAATEPITTTGSVSTGSGCTPAGSTASGGVCMTEAASTGWTPTAGFSYFRADTSHAMLISVNGSAEGWNPYFTTQPAGTKCVQTSGILGIMVEATGPCGSAAFPITVTGGVSGAVPCFTSTTVESAGAILNTNILTKGGGAGACPTNSSITDNATTVSTTEPIVTTAAVSTGTSPPTCTIGTAGVHCMNEGTAPTGAAAVDDLWANSTAHCMDENANNVELGCLLTQPAGLVGVQTVTGADYTNATVTPSTVFSWTLPATAAAKNYEYTCDVMWESTAATLVGPVFGINMSAAATQVTAAASVQNTLAGADINGYLSNATTGSQTVVTSSAAGVTSTNYWAKIWGTIEAAPTAGATFIINAASTSGTTALLNIRRGSACKMRLVQ